MLTNVAVYSLTWDRLYYTEHCFDTLREKAGYKFDHFVVDNGSTDGTVEWLNSQWSRGLFKKVLFNPENLGNAIGNNQAVRMIVDTAAYDLIIRMDNDCEVVTDGIVGKIVELFSLFGEFSKRYIVSPRVEGIVNQPHRARFEKYGQYKLGCVAVLGGLFRAADARIVAQYSWPKDQSKVFGEESICTWLKKRGGEAVYAENLVVNHYETTDGQYKRFPEYHHRKMGSA